MEVDGEAVTEGEKISFIRFSRCDVGITPYDLISSMLVVGHDAHIVPRIILNIDNHLFLSTNQKTDAESVPVCRKSPVITGLFVIYME